MILLPVHDISVLIVLASSEDSGESVHMRRHLPEPSLLHAQFMSEAQGSDKHLRIYVH